MKGVAPQMSDIPDWASEQIEFARRSGIGTLDLRLELEDDSASSRRRLEPIAVFPMEVLDLPNLRTLLLTENRISEIPPDIQRVQQLEVLNVAQNPLSALPEEIGRLPHLISLECGGCDLRTLPRAIGNLTHLRKLNINANLFGELPEWIARLNELRTLGIGSAGEPFLSELPHWIRTLHKLESLFARGHSIAKLPRWLVHLTKLTNIDVGNNRITEIPDVIFNMPQLHSLDLANLDGVQRWGTVGSYTTHNEVRDIPAEILRLRNLNHLNLHRNPVETPPMEILQNDLNRGIRMEALRSYFVQLEREGTDYLHEAKLLIVGEPGAGKTTLARKLIDPSYDLGEDDSTRGIDIRVWNFDSHSRRFRINLWDFGGQEIYHATHQFFLTRRSLYVLVADSRKEDTDFHYWLNVVELLSDGSPAIVLLNEKQDRFRDLNTRELRQQFSSLRNIVRVNLATDRGYADLISAISAQVESLPHIGTPLPKSWVNVRLALETDERPWVSSHEFERICSHHGFRSLDEKNQLAGFLHDLGVILYFQQDPVLCRTVILRPEWGTRAVYQILDDREVIEAGGRFDQADLRRLWSNPSHRDMRVELLRLMLNFGLCYEVPGMRDTYIAPQLLPASPPDYEWDDKGNLGVKFFYEFLPKGIIAQLIVHLHDLVERHSLAWKSGVVFARDGARAEVVEYYGQRQIQVRVVGSTKREMLGVISHAMGVVHSTFPSLRVQELIPCTCDFCKHASKPEYYPLGVLRQYFEDNQTSIQCRSSYANVSVRELLAEVSTVASSAKGIVRTATGELIEVPFGESATVEGAFTEIEGRSSTEILSEVASTTKVSPSRNNVWVNGSFYLVAVLVIFAGIGILANLVAPIVLPVAVVGGVLLVSIIGALQLRNDERLSDASFLELMGVALSRLPSLERSDQKSQEDTKLSDPRE